MRSGTPPRVAVAAVVLVILGVYGLRVNAAAGLMVDDAWYITLAKALAQGDGYALISSATTAILPAVPPGFPFALSLVMGVSSSFPENVLWLKAVSIAAMAILGVVGYGYLKRHERLPPVPSLLIVAATLVTPAWVFLVTSTVMADAMFAAAQMGAVLCVERALRDRRSLSSPAIAGGLAAVATLIRTAGVAVIVAGLLGLLLARRPRQSAVFAAVMLVCLAPWQWYAYQRSPTPAERLQHGGAIAFSYSELIAMNRGGDPTRGQATLLDASERIINNLRAVLLRDVGAVMVPSLYRGPAESGEEVVGVPMVPGLIPSMGAALGTKVVSLLLATIVLAGWCISARRRLSVAVILVPATLAMILAVPDQTFRYALPITPFLLLFLWRGLSKLGETLSPAVGHSAPRIAVTVMIGLNLLDHGQYIVLQRQRPAAWLADAREVDELLSWMSSHLHGPGFVASTNPGLVYLRTGRRGLSANDIEANWTRWEASGVRYVVALRTLPFPPERLKYRRHLETDRSKFWVIEICNRAWADNSC